MGRTVLRWLSTDAGALSRALRRADGRANEPSTIPPMDAISWRRLTSIVKSDLLSPKSEKIALAEVDFTAGGFVTQSRFRGTARNPHGNVTQTTPSPFRLPGGLVERPGVGDDVAQAGLDRAPAELPAGLVAGCDGGGGVARAAGGELDRDRAAGDLADRLDDLLVAVAVAVGS